MKIKMWKKILALLFLGVIIVAIYFPMIIIIVFSFTPSRAYGKWDGFNPLYYAKIFQEKDVMSAITNSLIIAVLSAILATLIGTISAIGVYNLGKKAKTTANTINQITIINSEIVTAAAFMLLFIIYKNFITEVFDVTSDSGGFGGLVLSIVRNNYIKLITAHTMITIPFVILSVTPRLSQLNPNIYEAGLDLGASPRGALFKVLIPQLIPGMISGFIMAFTLSLDDFVLTNFVKDEIETISTIIYNSFTKGGTSPVYRVLSALILYTVLAVLLVYNLLIKRNRAKKLNSNISNIVKEK